MKASKILRQAKRIQENGWGIDKGSPFHERAKKWLEQASNRGIPSETYILINELVCLLDNEDLKPSNTIFERIDKWLTEHANKATARRLAARANMEKAEAAFSKPVEEWPQNIEPRSKGSACADIPPLPLDWKCPERPLESQPIYIPAPVLTPGEEVFAVNRDLKGFPTGIKDINGREMLVGDEVEHFGLEEGGLPFTVIFANGCFRKKYHHRGWADWIMPTLHRYNNEKYKVVRGVREHPAPDTPEESQVPEQPEPEPALGDKWRTVNENTPQDQLPEHGDRLLVEDGAGAVHYAVYSGYLEFDVHRGYQPQSPRPMPHRMAWAKHSTGFVKKFMVFPPL